MRIKVNHSEIPLAITGIEFNQMDGKIGRSHHCEMCLPCEEKSVSRIHAEILYRNNEYAIVDQSANGVYINHASTPVGHSNQHILKHGDIIQIGSYVLEADFDDEEPHEETHEEDNPESFLHTSSSPLTNATHPISEAPISTSLEPQNQQPTLLESNTQSLAKPTANARHVDLGITSDNFTPPTTIIPKDWDLDPNASPKPAPQEKATVLDFSTNKSKGLENLLLALAPDTDLTVEQMTPETAALIGKTLRIAIKGIFATRKVVHEAKSRACLDNLPVDRQLEACPLDAYRNAEDFISALLDSRNADQKHLPTKIHACVKNNLEDQRNLSLNYHSGLKKAHENLSPAAIEISLDKAQKLQSKKSNAIESLSNKFTSQTKKWNFYASNWEKITESSMSKIGRDFEAKVLVSHAKRMRDKTNATN